MKWPWTKQEPTERQISRLEALEGWVLRLESLERQVKAISLDWDETYDKFRRLYARLAKRVSAANREETAEAAQLEATNGSGSPGASRPPGWERDKRFLRRLQQQTKSGAE